MQKIGHFSGKLIVVLLLAGALAGCMRAASGQPSNTGTVLYPTHLMTIPATGLPVYSGSPCADSGPQGTHLPDQADEVFAGQEIGTQSISQSAGGGFEQCARTTYTYAALVPFAFPHNTTGVTHALLTFSVLDDGTHPAASERVSCATALELATQDLTTQQSDVSSSSSYLTLPSGVMSQLSSSPTAQVDANKAQWTLDVTQAVQAWLSNQRPNDGFVLAGPENASQTCLSIYGGFTLTLS